VERDGKKEAVKFEVVARKQPAAVAGV
jgi:hypothetical protein